jgi:CPA2 family monovalent cation:H+ antiporter-2
MPLLIATMRKMRAAARLMAEVSITRGGTREHLEIMRSVVTNLLVAGAGLVMMLYILLIGSTILPSWPMLVVVLLAGLGVAIWQWRMFIRMYASAEGTLRDTLEAIPVVATPPPEPMPSLLRHAVLESVTVPEKSGVRGKLIRELQLRTSTGASIVGIERASQNLINPSPDEMLLADDRVLLVGGRDQVLAARKLILADAPVADPPVHAGTPG